MQLKYGTYAHNVAEIWLSTSRTPILSDLGTRMGYNERWTIDGFLQAASQAALTTAIQALEAAYSVNGNDLVLYDDSNNISAHLLLNSSSITGTRVSRPFYPEGHGAEYTTFRRYTITVEADIMETNVGYISFQQTIRFTGGGPNNRIVYLQTLVGQPQRQQVAQQVTYRAVQSGFSVGHFGWPPFPQPLLGSDALHWDQMEQEQESPQEIRPNASIRWPIRWMYPFESNSPLIGNPFIIP